MSKNTRKIVQCYLCNKSIERQQYRLKKNKKHFCSWVCKAAYNIKLTLNCKICNKEFKVWNGRKNAKYCSNECKWSDKTYLKRPSNIQNNDRQNALTTYGNECELCGWNLLVEVHHVDGDRNNHNIDNLMILCPNHHTLTEDKYRINSNYIPYKTRKEILKWNKKK